MSVIVPTNVSYGESVVSTIADPGAGNSVLITVPIGELWRPRAISAALNCSAAVASRIPVVRAFDPGLNAYSYSSSGIGFAAGTGVVVAFSLGGLPVVNAGGVLTAGLFDALLPAGHLFQLFALNFQAGDAFTVIRFHYERWRVTT